MDRRQKLQARAKELEKAKKAFIEGERLKRERAAKDAQQGGQGGRLVDGCLCGAFTFMA